MITLKILIEFAEQHKFEQTPLRLDSCSTILNQEKFFNSHLTMLKGNRGKKLFLPYYDRLVQYYKLITQNNNSNENKHCRYRVR